MAPSKLSSDARKRLAANLQVLRRYDSQIEAIIDTTSHVVLYQFQHETSSWAKKEVEGALFIFQRSAAPRYGFMVMNRLSLDNYTELLNSEISFQPTDQFLIYRSDGGEVIGIWIYEESDRIRISSQLEKCCKCAKSAFSGQSPQRLFPKNIEEEKEFLRTYTRSRSNSKRENNGNSSSSNSEDLTALISRTRMQQQMRQQQEKKKKQQQQQQQNTTPGEPTATSSLGSSSGLDLVSKLQALGLDPSGSPGGNGQGTAAPKPVALPSDPAIVLARKSSTTRSGRASKANEAHENTSPANAGCNVQQQPYLPNASGPGTAFRSPLPMPTSHVPGAMFHGGVNGTNVAPDMAIPPSSPTLHPAPSPYPPSTLATPLPGNIGTPRIGMHTPLQLQQQPLPPQFWHPQMGHPGDTRSAHASPAPPPNFAGMVPGLYGFPQLVHGHSGTPHPPVPMMPHQFVSGPPPPQTQPVAAADTATTAAVAPQQPTADDNAAGRPSTSIAHNLAEQLVSLVRERMTATQQPAPAPAPAPTSPQNPSSVSDVTKMQRDFCRNWLIHVIQSDDELVDAFAKRFPPPIFPAQPPPPPQQQQQQQQQQQAANAPTTIQGHQ